MANLLIAVLLGSIGIGYFIYGRRQQKFEFKLAAMGMFIVPFLFSQWYITLVAGVVLVLLPKYVKL